jgi:Carboxypeptidase regulatory-like domain
VIRREKRVGGGQFWSTKITVGISTYSLTGRATGPDGNGISGVALSDGVGHTTTTDSIGNYTLAGLSAGTYTVAPSKSGYTFSPPSRSVTVPPDATGVDFEGLCSVDTDDDGLCDDRELHGYIGIDLPAMGADPSHKDIFVEIDYMVDPGSCVGSACVLGHSHKPKPAAIARIVEAFKDAPVSNPDGVHGIDLHVDFGPETPMRFVGGNPVAWSALSRSNPLPHDDDLSWPEFYAFKASASNFNADRSRIFHYAIFAHFLDGHRCWSGQAPMPGTDLIVSLGGWGSIGKCDAPASRWSVGSEWDQAGTFMHELGHNLGLDHGGGDGDNFKPNYLSVMSYAFQNRGLIFEGNEGQFDFSRTDKIPPLVESNLDETVGLNGGSSSVSYGTRWYCSATDKTGQWHYPANNPLDWNCDGSYNAGVHTSVNQNATEEALNGYFDWVRLVYNGGGGIGSAPVSAAQVKSSLPEELTLDDDRLLYTPYRVEISGPGGVEADIGITVTYTFTVTNSGANSDTYDVAASSSLGWADLASLPSERGLSPGADFSLPVTVTVPLDAPRGSLDELRLQVTSQNSPSLGDTVTARTVVPPRRVYLPLSLR